MARARDPNRDKAYEIYKANSGIELIEIASQLNIPVTTVRSWKARDKWECNGTQRNANMQRNVKTVEREVEEVMKNTELNDKQRLFCLNYIKCFNATKAYQKVYGCSYETAMSNGSDLLRNTKVKEQILSLKQSKLNQSFLEPSDIFQKYMDIAFSDMNDFVNITKYGVTAKEGIDGSIIDTISPSQFGLKIKLADRMKALQWLTDHMDMATEKQKAEIAKLKYEVIQLSGNEDAKEGINDFLTAVNPTQQDIKELFNDEVTEDGEETETE